MEIAGFSKRSPTVANVARKNVEHAKIFIGIRVLATAEAYTDFSEHQARRDRRISFHFSNDEFHRAGPILHNEWGAPVTLAQDDRHLPAEFLVGLLDRFGLLMEPRIVAITNMQQGDAGFGEGGEVFQR